MLNEKRNTTAHVVTRVRLITGPSVNPRTNLPQVDALEFMSGSRHQIDLSVLPPGVTLNLVQGGQDWVIERRSGKNRLSHYVGELQTDQTSFNNIGDLLVGIGPSQASILPISTASGQILTTDGISVYWGNLPLGDPEPSENIETLEDLKLVLKKRGILS